MSVLSLESKYFGEGITAYKNKIVQLTWKSKTGFVYDKHSFKLITTLKYPTDGWGITSDKKRLIMSDGSQVIHFLDPESIHIRRMDMTSLLAYGLSAYLSKAL